MSETLNLHAYFERINYAGPCHPTLKVLHALTAAHSQAIPFENLDVLLGKPVELSIDRIFEKLVLRRRGGYCFEQNGLFLQILQQLGFDARPLSARVRLDRPRDFVPPRTHMFLGVRIGGEVWLTDVGIGGVSLTSALRLDEPAAQTTPHDTRRIVQEGTILFHQVRFGDAWEDVCEFTLEEMPPIDRELANWFTSTHPDSFFRKRLMVARAASDGQRLTLINNEFSMREREGQATKRFIQTPEDLLNVLEIHFGMHFAVGTRFEPEGISWFS